MSGRQKVHRTLFELQAAAAAEKRDRELDELLARQRRWQAERSAKVEAQKQTRLQERRRHIAAVYAQLASKRDSAQGPPSRVDVAFECGFSEKTLSRFPGEWYELTHERLGWPPSTWPEV